MMRVSGIRKQVAFRPYLSLLDWSFLQYFNLSQASGVSQVFCSRSDSGRNDDNLDALRKTYAVVGLSKSLYSEQ